MLLSTIIDGLYEGRILLFFSGCIIASGSLTATRTCSAFLPFAARSAVRCSTVSATSAADAAWRADNLHRLYTRVARGLIRVDADEVTYPAHVILRYRLERALIAGDMAIGDLPSAWSEAMRELDRQRDLPPRPKNVWDVIQEFRADQERDPVDMDPDEVFRDVRDRSPGRDFSW